MKYKYYKKLCSNGITDIYRIRGDVVYYWNRLKPSSWKISNKFYSLEEISNTDNVLEISYDEMKSYLVMLELID